MTQNEKAHIISSQYDGIFPPHEIFYMIAIKYSAKRSYALFDEYEMNKLRNPHPDQLIYLLHEALNHSASLSRYFWPSSPGNKNREPNPIFKLREKRGAKLKKYFKMEKTSVLSDRGLRNLFEHYDERLDNYMIKTMELGGRFFPSPIIGNIDEFEGQYNKLFRFLDIGKEILVLLGKKFELKPIKDEITRIIWLLDYFDKKGGRLSDIEEGNNLMIASI